MTGQQLKNSILQLAIQGKLVPQDPNDEPASELLKRIRKEKEQLVKDGKLKKSILKIASIESNECPYELPPSWIWCKLGEIGEWGAGATPAKGHPEFYSNGTIPWLRTGELNNGFVYDSEIKVSEEALKKCSLRMNSVGDVLIAMYGATIGKVAIAGIPLTTNQACCACTPILIYNKYLLYYLMASKQAFIELGEGGAQPNISREKIVEFPLSLPPLAEQKRIVAKIEELLPLVEEYGIAQEELNKLNATLPDKLRQSILQEAIMGKLVPQDPNDEPVTLKETNGIKSFDIPSTWKWVQLQDVVDFINGRAYKKEELLSIGKYKVLRVGNFFTNDSWYYSNLELEDDKYCYAGDLLYAWSASFGPKIWEGEKTIFHYHIWNVKYNKQFVYRDYLYYFLEYDKTRVKSATTGSTMIHVSMANMKPRLFPLPPLAEQHRIVAKLEEILPKLDELK